MDSGIVLGKSLKENNAQKNKESNVLGAVSNAAMQELKRRESLKNFKVNSFADFAQQQQYKRENPNVSALMGGVQYNPIPHKNPTLLTSEGYKQLATAQAWDKAQRNVADKNKLGTKSNMEYIVSAAMTEAERQALQRAKQKYKNSLYWERMSGSNSNDAPKQSKSELDNIINDIDRSKNLSAVIKDKKSTQQTQKIQMPDLGGEYSSDEIKAIDKYADLYAQYTGMSEKEDEKSTLARLVGDLKNNANYQKSLNQQIAADRERNTYLNFGDMTEHPREKVARTAKNLLNDILMTPYDDISFRNAERNNDLKYLTPEELQMYYRKKDISPAEGDAFFKSAIPVIEARKVQSTIEWAQKFGHEHSWIGTGLSFLTNIGSAPEQLGNMIRYAETGTMGYNTSALVTSGIRGAVSEKTDWKIKNWDAFDFVYNTVSSGVDSMLNGALFGALGAGTLGLSAAANQSNDILQRGGTSEQAFWGGLAAGTFETIFEKWTIGNIKALKEIPASSAKTFFKNMAKSMLTNASEETLTEIANVAYDTFLNADISQYKMLVEQYMQENISPEEAEKKAQKALIQQIIEAGLSGALMGFGFTAAYGSKGLVNANKNSYNQIGGNVRTQKLTNTVFSMAENLDESSASRKYAQTLSEDGNYTDVDLGRLTVMVVDEMRQTAFVEVEGAIYDRLLDVGQTSQDASKNAKSMATLLANMGISQEQKTQLLETVAPSEVYSELVAENSPEWVQNLNDNLKEYVGKLSKLSLAFDSVETQAAREILQSTANGGIKPNTGVSEATSDEGASFLPENAEESGSAFEEPSAAFPEYDLVKDTGAQLAGVKRYSDGQRQIMEIGRKLGYRVVFDPNLTNASGVFANGKIDRKNKVIYINPKSQRVKQWILKHELVHFGKRSDAYNQYAEIVKKSDLFYDWLKSRGANGDNAIIMLADLKQKKMDAYAEAGQPIGPAKAEEEILGDFSGDVVFSNDERGMQRFLESLDIRERNAVVQFILDFVSYLKEKFSGNKQMTVELARLERRYSKMIHEAKETTADSNFNENQFSIPDSIMLDSMVDYNLSVAESHQEKLAEKYTTDASIDLKTLQERYSKIIGIWEKLGGELNSKFLNEWNNKVGKDRAFTIFKAQAGYKYNVELSSMCKKGVPLFEAIDTIVKKEVMNELKTKTLGKAEKEILYDILKNHNFEIPCAICYVEQARQREGVIINDFLDGKIEKNAKGKITKYKLGWNDVLNRVEKEMKKNGVDYTFRNVDKSIATDNYAPADIVMNEATQDAFYKALKKVANAEIVRWNREDRKSNQKERRQITDIKPQTIKEVFKGTLPSNLKIFKVLFNNPSSRFKISRDLLYSSATTLNLANSHNDLYSLFNSQGGVSGYKTKQAPIVYWGDILGKSWRPSTVRKEGGIRNQSNSDFQMYTLLDQAQMYIDFSAKGYYLQAYTKVLAELKLFGLSRGKINASLIPQVIEYKNADGSINWAKTMENAGLDENGNPIYDDFEGINHTEAFMLIEDAEYSKNICGICIGYSDNHIRKLLDDNRVQQIIGFHDKTDNPKKRYRGAKYAKNYNGLNEAVKIKADGTKETVHIGFNQFVSKAEKMFKFNKKTETFEGTVNHNGKEYSANDIPRLAADLYLEMCAEKNYRPAYNDFSSHKNYYKLLADFGLYDSQGNYAPHQKVQYNMPDKVPYLDKNGNKAYMSTEAYIKAELQKELTVRDSISEALADTSENGIIPQFVKRVNELHTEADTNSMQENEDYSLAVEKDVKYSISPDSKTKRKKGPYQPVENYEPQTRDADGHKLSQGILDYFKYSMVRDSKGRLIPVYHGSKNAGFTRFAKSDDIGYFFARTLKTAQTYSGTKKIYAPDKNSAEFSGAANYKTFLNLKNPYIIDGNGLYWNNLESYGYDPVTVEIKSSYWNEDGTGKATLILEYKGKTYKQTAHNSTEFENFLAEHLNREIAVAFAHAVDAKFDENGKGHFATQIPWDFSSSKQGKSKNTRDIVRRSKGWNYDGVIFRNVIDSGDGSKIGADDLYVAFYPNQIKSVNNTEPTSDPDIRYSLDTNDETVDYTERMNVLDDDFKSGTITREEYFEKINALYKEAGEKNGTVKQGESVSGKENFDNPLPQSVKDKTKVRTHVRTIIEGGELTEEMIGDIKHRVLKGEFSYVPTSNEKNKESAQKYIESGAGKALWDNIINGKEKPSAVGIAVGEALLKGAIENGEAADVVKYTAELAELGTRLGQSVQALSLLKRMDGIGQLYYVQKTVNTLNKDLSKRFGADAPLVTLNETLARQLAQSKTQEDFETSYGAMMDHIASQVPSTFLDKWNAWRYMAMLANPTTHIRNVAGNAVFVPAIKIKDAIAVGMEQFLPQDERTKSVVVKKEYKDFAEKDFGNVADVISGGGKMNPSRGIADNRAIFKNKVLESSRKFNFDMLEKEDLIFLKKHYQRALGGYLQAQGVDLKNVSNKVLQKAREYAILEAQKATYRDASALATALSDLSQKNAVANVLVEGILPFKKTPINIVKRGIEYSPVGLIKTLTQGTYQLKRGEITASQYIDGLAAGLTGTGLVALGMGLASLGFVRGGFDDDDEDRFNKLMGMQEYSVEIGGVSYTIDWMAPSSIPFFIGVTVMENMMAEDNSTTFSMISNSLLSGMEPIINLSMLSGIEDTIASARYADANEIVSSIAGKIIGSYFSQALPTIGARLANMVDPVRRTNYIDKTSHVPKFVQSAINTIEGKVPFASKLKAKYINAWGEKEYKGGVVERFFQNFLSPGYLSDVEIDNISEEIMRLAKSLGDKSVYPDTAPKKVQFKNMTKYLDRKEYEKYAIEKGQMSADYVKEAVESKAYSKLEDYQKAWLINKLYEFADAKAKTNISYSYDELNAMFDGAMTKEQYERFNAKARKTLAEDYFLNKKGYKTAFKKERNGASVVDYYIKQAAKVEE